MCWLRCVLLGALAAGCARAPGAQSAHSPFAPIDWTLPSTCTNTPAGLESAVELARNDDAIAYKVSYRVDGLRIQGQLCVPRKSGPFPIVVYNHGGVGGLGGDWGLGTQEAPNACANLTASGYLGVMSQYRGESDGQGASEGRVEFCLGEATDALELLRLVRQRCDVDPHRVAMFGGSHGSCITMNAIPRGPPLRAAAGLVGLHDLVATRQWHEGRDSDLSRAMLKLLDDTAGALETNHEGYLARSPLLHAAELAKTPLMLIHGTADELVPHFNSCRLASKLVEHGKAVATYHLSAATGAVMSAPVPDCPGLSLETQLPPEPRFEGDHALLLLEGQGHGPSGPSMAMAVEALADFLRAHLD